MLKARDVGEAHVELFGVVFFSEFQDFFRAHPSSIRWEFRSAETLAISGVRYRITTGCGSVNWIFAEVVAVQLEAQFRVIMHIGDGSWSPRR